VSSAVLLFVTSFFASAVEAVEALTIVLAVGVVRGWRSTLIGVAAAAIVLAAIVAVLGPALRLIPIETLRFVIGALLLAFGLQWLRKAILRSSGHLALHDEDETFLSETDAAHAAPRERRFGLDWYAFTIAFKGVLLEGLEVLFIVVSFGASTADRAPAALGAAVAFGLVLLVGIVVHRPLSRVPENLIKHGVGLLLSTFGVFWLVEGLNAVAKNGHPVEWPGGDVSLPVILLAWFACTQFCIRALRRAPLGVLA
jgi:uncharacterized membrane protein